MVGEVSRGIWCRLCQQLGSEMIDYFFKNKPSFSDEEIARCKEKNNFISIAFEWSKYLAVVCNKLASISRDSPGAHSRPELQYVIVQGLLNRNSRLMYSMIYLGRENKFDETIRILARCQQETLLTVQWLVKYADKDSFRRYLRKGLEGDEELWAFLEGEIEKRDGKTLVMEERMLNSIKRSFNTAEITRDELKQIKGMPSFRQICEQLGYNDMAYVSVMRIGSHAVHGTWSDLLFSYIEQVEGRFQLRDNDRTSPSENFYTTANFFTISTLKSYISFILTPDPQTTAIIDKLDSIGKEVWDYREQSAEGDYNFV